MKLCRVHGVGRVLIIIAACVALGACSSTPSAGPPVTASSTPNAIPTATPTVAITPSPIPTADGDAVYWALDRGPEGTPDQARLRVYVFGVLDLQGPVTLFAPDGSVAGTAPVMGSGMFSAASCVSRVPGIPRNGLIAIGVVQMSEAAQAAFLARPTAYRAEVDRSQRTPGAGSVVVRLVDSGCRPT
jgi:hypothetical protein